MNSKRFSQVSVACVLVLLMGAIVFALGVPSAYAIERDRADDASMSKLDEVCADAQESAPTAPESHPGAFDVSGAQTYDLSDAFVKAPGSDDSRAGAQESAPTAPERHPGIDDVSDAQARDLSDAFMEAPGSNGSRAGALPSAREDAPEPLAAADDPVPYEGSHVNMYRLYNPNSGEHFYTSSLFEAQAVATAGWRWEGVGWVAPTENDRSVFRLYNPNAGDHHYTLSSLERDHLVSVGWSLEGIGWYSDFEDQTAVLRQYNPNAVAGAHNFTTSAVEDEFLGGAGWNCEGVAWYATDGPSIAIDGFWLVTNAWGGFERYWIGSDAQVAMSRLINPEEGSGWWAYATGGGAVARGKHDTGWGRVYVADAKGELASTADGKTGWLVTDAYDGGWQRYYYDAASRAMLSGFFDVDGQRYYGVGGQGYVLRNEYLYDNGQWYHADNGGVLSPIAANEVKNALISVIDHASGAGYLTVMGNANYNLGSAAGARLANAVNQIWASGSGVGFVMMDLTTGHGVACSPHDIRYSASTIKGPYVAAINHYAPGAVDGYIAWLMDETIRYSSNEDYAELRDIFGGDVMQWQMDYSGVASFDPHSRYVDFSAADLAKLWVGNYWYFYKETNEQSAWCRDLYTQGEVGSDALIYNALGGSYTVHAKPGWFPGGGFDVQNDAGIVMAGDRPYVLSVLSSACMNYGALTELIWALDAVHSDMI